MKLAPPQKAVSIGVDMGHQYLRLVKATRGSDGRGRLLDYRKVAFPPAIPKGSAEFIHFLKTEISRFGGTEKDIAIWSLISAAHVDVRHLRIPKVGRNEMENAVFWTLKREAPFDEKESIFDFEIQGEVMDAGASKWSAMTYTAPRELVQEQRKMFLHAGLPLDGITITPFAIQNIFRTGWVPTADETIASLFMGNDFSRIDIYSGGNLAMTRGIKSGLSSMSESLMETFNERLSADRRSLINMDQARRLINSLSPDSAPLQEVDAGYGLTQAEIFEMITPALERLARQVERTFEHYTTTHDNARIDKIFVSGAMNVYRPLMTYVGDQLGIPSDILDPLNTASSGIVSPDGDSISERVAFLPALGLALSDNALTPNMIFTYKEKQTAARVSRVNRVIIATFAVAVLICGSVMAFQWALVSQKRGNVAKLEQQLSQFNPRTDQGMIKQMLEQAKQQQILFKSYADRYKGLAVISELSARTPANVNLISMNATFNAPAAAPKPGSEPTKDGAKADPALLKLETDSLTIEGIVTGDTGSLEPTLYKYKLALEESRMFKAVSIQKKDLEPFKRSQILRFLITVQIG